MPNTRHLLGPLERLLFLRSMNTLTGLPPDASAKLALVAQDRFYPRGTTICEDGVQVDSVFLIVEGTARISWDDRTLDVGRGDGLNWLRLLSGRGTSRRSVALEDVTALEIRATDLVDLYEESPELLEGSIREYTRAILNMRGPLPTTEFNELPPLGEAPTEPLGLVGKIGVVAEAGPVWRQAGMDTLVTIARHLIEVRIPKGDSLWRMGEPADAPYWIRYGNVRCTDAEGNYVDIAAPYGLGFYDAMVGEVRCHHAIALTDLVVLRWDMGTIFGVLELMPLTAMGLLRMIAEMLSSLFDVQASQKPEVMAESA
ncbi:MAG: CRP-like cAMP-binding protein [Myxococcota bacterium]|jgi:CRP-like cAMP-binding protein